MYSVITKPRQLRPKKLNLYTYNKIINIYINNIHTYNSLSQSRGADIQRVFKSIIIPMMLSPVMWENVRLEQLNTKYGQFVFKTAVSLLIWSKPWA